MFVEKPGDIPFIVRAVTERDRGAQPIEGAKQRPPSSCRMPLEKIFNTDRGRPAGHRLRAKQPPDEATGAAKLKHVVDAKKPAGA